MTMILGRCTQRIVQRLAQQNLQRTVYTCSSKHIRYASSLVLTKSSCKNVSVSARQFSKGTERDDSDSPKNEAKESTDSREVEYRLAFESDEANDDDPFGVSFSDGEDKLGPSLPPSYKRDPTTGKFTGEVETELTEGERRLLSLTDEEKLEILQRRFLERKDWDEDKERQIARSIQDEEAALTVLGRNKLPPRLHRRPLHDEGPEPAPSSAPLSPEEFASFKKYAKEAADAHVSEDDIPVQRLSSGSSAEDTGHDVDQDLTWIKPDPDAWMEEITPHHLSPMRKLNRREAKLLPRHILHHNNLELLRRYITPGGQILNRYKSRLGAKDQRKVAKLIKRARHLGLIPHIGQWKLEDCGDVFADNAHDKRWWELELEKMGLYLDGTKPTMDKDNQHIGQWKFQDSGDVFANNAHDKRWWELHLEKMGLNLDGTKPSMDEDNHAI